jgi:hypothetical protein
MRAGTRIPAHVVISVGPPVSHRQGKGGRVLRESLIQRESAGAQTLCLRSCHSLWIFDVEHRRFRRLPAAVSADIAPGPENWEPFVALHVDHATGAFRVTLNDERTRVLRSWLHDEPCPHCGAPGRYDDDAAHTGEILLHS